MNVTGTKIKKKEPKKHELQHIREDIMSLFSLLEFDEPSHSYKIGTMNFTSVTETLESLSEPFNEYVISTIMGRDNVESILGKKIDRNYYLRRWSQIRDQATFSGSRVHEYLEYNYPDFELKPRCKQEKAGKDFLLNLDTKYSLLFAELRIYDKVWAIAGTIDLLIYNKETNKLVIADWKTNDTNITQVYKKKKLKSPFDNLWSHDLNKYFLQLSLYKSILERNSKYEVEDMWIIHLSDSDRLLVDANKDENKYHIEDIKPTIEKDNYKVYKVIDYSKELSNYFNKDE